MAIRITAILIMEATGKDITMVIMMVIGMAIMQIAIMIMAITLTIMGIVQPVRDIIARIPELPIMVVVRQQFCVVVESSVHGLF